MTQSYK